VLVGNIGVFSAGVAASQSDRGNGTKYLVGFDRQTPFVSVGARMYRASEQYEEIGDFGPRFSQSWNVYARGSMGRYGSVAAGYTSLRYYSANALSIYTASYSVNVSPRAFLSLTASRFTGRLDQTQVLAVLTIPLDTLTSASVSAQSNRHGGESTLIGEAYVQRSLPVGNGYGYYLRANTERVASGGVTYAGPYGRYTLEATGDSERAGLRASAAGGIAWVGDAMMFAQPIEQGFALVRVGELEGVRVLQSNQDVGMTQRGRLMLAQVPPLSPAMIAIDPLSVPIDVTLNATTQQIVILPRTGVVVDFIATRERNALVRLTLPSGVPVPIGAVVQIDGRSEQFPVGHDGEAFLTRLSDRQTLLIQVAGKRCAVVLTLDPTGPSLADIGPLRCDYLANPASSEGKQ